MNADLLQGFYLGDFFVEPLKGGVTGRSGSRHLPPKAVEVLLCLASTPGELVTRETLIESVWGHGNGSHEALSHAVTEIRHALEDHAADPRFIQTLPTRGYRLVVDPVASSQFTGSVVIGADSAASIADLGIFESLQRRGVIETAVAYLVLGWLLIQVADTTFEELGLPAWSEPFVTFAVIGGFPLLVLLAWFFEFVEGRLQTDRGDQPSGFFQRLGRNYLAIFIAYGGATIGAGVYQATVGFSVAEPAPAKSVAVESELIPVTKNSAAVLRLATFDDDSKTKAFSDGLSEDILDGLARIPGLQVSARGDSWSLPPHASSDVVRRRLRVAHYIEGSVRFLDDKLRVVVQLIDSKTGFHLFSRDFEIDIASIGDMQREVTELVIANLKLAVDESTIDAVTYAHAGLNEDAYLFYRLGREALYLPRSEENFEEAIARFNEALTFDADYPAAHAGLCEAYASLFELREDSVLLEHASAACARAQSVAPQLPVVVNSVARLYRLTGKLFEAEQLYATALDLNDQDVAALRGLAKIRRQEQRFDEAEYLMQRANSLQPGNWQEVFAVGNMYFNMSRYSDAATEYRKVLFLDPGNFAALTNLATVSMMHGDFDGAREAFLRAVEIEEDPTLVANLALTYYYTGDFNAAVDTYRRAIELAPKSVANRIGLADSLQLAGRVDEALDQYAMTRESALEHLEVRTNDVETLYFLAWAQAQGGDIYTAQATAHRAVELNPGDPYAHYFEAIVELHAGKTDEAIAAASRALDADFPIAVLAAEPILEELWSDSRFVELMARRSGGGQEK